MKRTIYIIAVLFVFPIADTFSQARQGSVLLGASSSLSLSSMSAKVKSGSTSQDMGSVFTIEFAPTFGYFVADGFAIGLIADISSETDKDPDGSKYSYTSLVIGPFIRYYFLEGNVKPFIHVDGGYATMKQKSDLSDDTINGFGFDGGAGVAIYLNENVAFELGLGYGLVSLKNPDVDDVTLNTSGINFAIGISVDL